MRLRRLMLLAGAAALAVVVAVSGQAGRAAPSPSLTVDAPIVELQADAGRVIFRTLSDAATCRELVVWSPSTGARVALPGSGSGCANYGGYGGVALAGGTAAWVPELNGNNTAETYLYLASLDSKRPHPEESDSASADGYGAGTVISNLRGGDGFIAYNRSERCSTDNPDFPPQLVCPPGYDSGEAVSDEISLAAPSPRVIATSDHNLTQLAVGGGRVVARAHGGAVVVLAPTRRPAPLVRRAGYKAERPIASYAYLPERALTVATDGHTLAVLHGTTLDVIPLPGTKRTRTSRALPPAPGVVRLADLDGTLAVYLYRNAVYLLNVTTGRRVRFATPTGRNVPSTPNSSPTASTSPLDRPQLHAARGRQSAIPLLSSQAARAFLPATLNGPASRSRGRRVSCRSAIRMRGPWSIQSLGAFVRPMICPSSPYRSEAPRARTRETTTGQRRRTSPSSPCPQRPLCR